MKTNGSTYLIVCTAAALLAGAAAWALLEHKLHPAVSRNVSPAISAEMRPSYSEFYAPQRLVAIPSPNEESPRYSELFYTGDDAVRSATTLILTSHDASQRAQAADSLAARGTFDAVNNLVNLALIERNAEVRIRLLESFRNVSSSDGLQALASVITATRQKDVVDASVASLARSGSREVIDALVEFYRERSDGPFQKNAALRAIRGMQNPEAARALGKLVAHAPEPALVDAASQALTSMRREDTGD